MGFYDEKLSVCNVLYVPFKLLLSNLQFINHHTHRSKYRDLYCRLTIDTITIRQDAEGRYCLNDLHRAAGGDNKHRPVYFLDRDETADLCDAIAVEKVGIPTVSTLPGRNGGTYVAKELVYAYAMWISAVFHLKVIRAYDTLATKGIAVHENAAASFLENPLPFKCGKSSTFTGAYMGALCDSIRLIDGNSPQFPIIPHFPRMIPKRLNASEWSKKNLGGRGLPPYPVEATRSPFRSSLLFQ